jgi:hypothetical protein
MFLCSIQKKNSYSVILYQIVTNFIFLFFLPIFEKMKNKYKPIEPIDYDEYVEKNINNLKKDTYKNLILLPDDDIYVSIIFGNLPQVFSKFYFKSVKLKNMTKVFI